VAFPNDLEHLKGELQCCHKESEKRAHFSFGEASDSKHARRISNLLLLGHGPPTEQPQNSQQPPFQESAY
jgi:hypothetical protein